MNKEDLEAFSGSVIDKGSQLLFTADLEKAKLDDAYKITNEIDMTKSISEIITICKETKNKNFEWFSRLLESHFLGFIAHATYKISSGKIAELIKR
jgi:hypothetical protein